MLPALQQIGTVFYKARRAGPLLRNRIGYPAHRKWGIRQSEEGDSHQRKSRISGKERKESKTTTYPVLFFSPLHPRAPPTVSKPFPRPFVSKPLIVSPPHRSVYPVPICDKFCANKTPTSHCRVFCSSHNQRAVVIIPDTPSMMAIHQTHDSGGGC